MEFFLGAITTLACIYLASKMVQRAQKTLRSPYDLITQGKKFDLLSRAGLVHYRQGYETLNTQATKHHDSFALRVVLMENRAYWIQDSKLHQAELVNGQMDSETTKIVDTMALDSVELKKISTVVDKLTGRDMSNEKNSNPGDEVF